MKKRKEKKVAPVPAPAPQAVETAEVVVEKKHMVNCPKCSTLLSVKEGNFAHLCPVCSSMFRIRKGQKLVKDITRKTMVEAFVTVDKDDKGVVSTNSIVNQLDK